MIIHILSMFTNYVILEIISACIDIYTNVRKHISDEIIKVCVN